MAARARPPRKTTAGDVEVKITANTDQAVKQLNEVSTAAKAATAPKAGYLTTEFWSSLGGFIVLILPLFHVVAAPEAVKAVTAAAGALVLAVYALVRSQVKTAHANAVRQAITAKPLDGA
jgi:hypothetical protein